MRTEYLKNIQLKLNKCQRINYYVRKLFVPLVSWNYCTERKNDMQSEGQIVVGLRGWNQVNDLHYSRLVSRMIFIMQHKKVLFTFAREWFRNKYFRFPRNRICLLSVLVSIINRIILLTIRNLSYFFKYSSFLFLAPLLYVQFII